MKLEGEVEIGEFFLVDLINDGEMVLLRPVAKSGTPEFWRQVYDRKDIPEDSVQRFVVKVEGDGFYD